MKALEIKLYIKYSELDKEMQFGLEFENAENYTGYIRWIYFHMGKYLGLNKDTIYPFKLDSAKIIKYKYCNDAIRQAKMIVHQIQKHRKP